MINKEMQDKFVELDGDKEFVKRLSLCESFENACELYASEGLEFTPGEMETLAKLASCDIKGTELNEDDLAEVAGGFGLAALVIGWTVVNVAVQGTALALSRLYAEATK